MRPSTCPAALSRLRIAEGSVRGCGLGGPTVPAEQPVPVRSWSEKSSSRVLRVTEPDPTSGLALSAAPAPARHRDRVSFLRRDRRRGPAVRPELDLREDDRVRLPRHPCRPGRRPRFGNLRLALLMGRRRPPAMTDDVDALAGPRAAVSAAPRHPQAGAWPVQQHRNHLARASATSVPTTWHASTWSPPYRPSPRHPAPHAPDALGLLHRQRRLVRSGTRPASGPCGASRRPPRRNWAPAISGSTRSIRDLSRPR